MKAHHPDPSPHLLLGAREYSAQQVEEDMSLRFAYPTFRFTHWTNSRLDFRIASGLWPDTSTSFAYARMNETHESDRSSLESFRTRQ